MLRNLRAEMARNDIHKTIDKTEKTAREKVLGKTAFTFPEAIKIRDKYFPGIPLEYLFADDGSTGKNSVSDA